MDGGSNQNTTDLVQRRGGPANNTGRGGKNFQPSVEQRTVEEEFKNGN